VSLAHADPRFVGERHLPFTHQFLAQMLGVQRTSVTIIAGRLKEAGLIKYRRGHIEVLDPVHLRDGACECYETINHHFERLVGWRPMDHR
jgi:hypothetical protein